jgi:predicted secreted protein
MPFIHGKSSKFSIDNSAGSLTDISTYCDEVSLSRDIETAEVTAFGNSAKAYITGLTDGSISISGKFDGTASTGIDAILSGILGQAATVSWEYQPNNAAVGVSNPKFTGEGIVTSYEVSGSVGDAVTWSAEIQATGTITRATS